MDISELLIFAVDNKGSDLHVSSGEQPFIRINGEMRKVELPHLDREDVHNGSFGDRCDRCHEGDDWKKVKMGTNVPQR